MRNSPTSGKPMTQEHRDGVTIDVCPDGTGIFLDKTELHQLIHAARFAKSGFPWLDLFRREVNPPVDHDRRLTCPVTGEKMRLLEYKGVFIDVSSKGVWLDAGELDALLNNLRLDPTYARGMSLRLKELEF